MTQPQTENANANGEQSPTLEFAGTYLGASDILSADDMVYRDVHVPEWKGWVRMRGMTATERSKYEQSIVKMLSDGSKRFTLAAARERLLSFTIVDKSGNNVFTEEHIVALGKKNASVVNRLFDIAQEMSGLTNADMERLVGNSDSDRSDAQ